MVRKYQRFRFIQEKLEIYIFSYFLGDESTGSGGLGDLGGQSGGRTYSRKSRTSNGGIDLHNPSAWRSYDQEPLSSDQDSRDSGTLVPVPKFDVDPEVPLETMVALDSASDQSGEPDTDHMKHNTGWYLCIVFG